MRYLDPLRMKYTIRYFAVLYSTILYTKDLKYWVLGASGILHRLSGLRPAPASGIRKSDGNPGLDCFKPTEPREGEPKQPN